MGKIVRGARVVEQAYTVAVPAVVREPERKAAGGELDPRFGGPVEVRPFEDVADHDFSGVAFDDDLPAEPQVDWEQVRADARALVDSAATEAQNLLQESARRARELVAAAQQRVTEIEDAAQARGHETGLEHGREAAQAELAEAVAAMHELVENVRQQRHTIIESAEPEIVKLAMTIGERIVHEQISVDPNIVIESVRHALTRLVGREVVTLRVHPADLETIRQHRDAIAASNDVEHLRVVEDQRVDRGGVVIETEAGTIDAKITTQLREARRTLLSGDTIATAPTGEQAALHSPAQAS